jgi:serine/threonine-protein kinase RsbW
MSAEPRTSCEFETKDLLVRLDLTLSGEVKSINPVVDDVMGLVQQMGCAAGRELEVETALREALANAIRHGCAGDAKKAVQCSVSCDRERGMLIVVRDPGPGFDPSQIPSPVTGQHLFSSHGRGIYLINQLMDEVRFERGGTEIRMRTKPRSDPRSAPPRR